MNCLWQSPSVFKYTSEPIAYGVVTSTTYKTYPTLSITSAILTANFTSPDIAQDVTTEYIKLQPIIGFSWPFLDSDTCLKVPAENPPQFFTRFEPTTWVCVDCISLEKFTAPALTLSQSSRAKILHSSQTRYHFTPNDRQCPTRITLCMSRAPGFFWARSRCFLRHIIMIYLCTSVSKNLGLSMLVFYWANSCDSDTCNFGEEWKLNS